MTAEELHWRCLAVSASGLMYWAGVLIQARRIRRRIGRSPNLKPRSTKESALWLGWFLVIVLWIGQPLVIRATATAPPGGALFAGLLDPFALALGLGLLGLGYAGTLWTYVALGDMWRIGINRKEKTELVKRGPYRWVRHPIYGFQIVMLTGAALLLPTAVSIATLLLHFGCVLIKAQDEERHLACVHGGSYSAYRSRTGGLFPRCLPGRRRAGGPAARGVDS
jgi:protein-S-isoprenylcysteine O-methyltransferase Ste14